MKPERPKIDITGMALGFGAALLFFGLLVVGLLLLMYMGSR